MPKIENENSKNSFLFSRVCAIVTIFIASLVLLGWILHIGFLLNIYPGWPPLKVNTSICFILTGVSLYIIASSHLSKSAIITVLVLNGIVVIIATLTLLEFLFDTDLGIDQIIVKDYLHGGVRPPGRMALLSVICFLLFSISILGTSLKKIKQGQDQYLLLFPLFIGFFALIAYMYQAYSILFSQYLNISFLNAILLMTTSIGLIFINTQAGWVKIALSTSGTGIFFRRIIISNLLAFVFLGYIRELGEKMGYFNSFYGISILVASEIVVVTILVIFLSQKSFATEQQLEASENRLQIFIQQVPSAISMFDKNMRYLAASRKWLEDYNLIGKDVIGKNHYDLFPELSDDWKQVHQRCLQGATEKRSRDIYQAPDGSILWLRWEVRPWYNPEGNIGGITISAENITNDVEQENKILNLNEKLEDLNEQKTKLFSIIAHDLRGPLSGCNEFLTFVRENKNELTHEELFYYLDTLQKHANTTFGLVEELLLWGKNQMKQVIFEPVENKLADKVLKIFSMLGKMAIEKEIKLITDIPSDFKVEADTYMLDSIIRNLVSNAIKFTLPGGWIKVSALRRENLTEVFVQDNGIGIKEEDQEKILNNMYGHTTYGTKGEKGTGLGLILTKDFVEKHGGTLNLRSKPGEGSTFSFTIPDKINKV